jgi:hypothetical protein
VSVFIEGSITSVHSIQTLFGRIKRRQLRGTLGSFGRRRESLGSVDTADEVEEEEEDAKEAATTPKKATSKSPQGPPFTRKLMMSQKS